MTTTGAADGPGRGGRLDAAGPPGSAGRATPAGADTHLPPEPGAARRARVAVALAARTAPWRFALYVTVTLLAGGLPVLTAWLTKLVLNGLTGPSVSTGAVVALAGGLAAAGVVAAMVPVVARYQRAELDRRVGLAVRERLFVAVDRIVGLGPFENPRFLDRLRLAQQGAMLPNEALDGGLGVLRAGITIASFLGVLWVVSPAMTVLTLAAGVPTLLTQLALARRRARVFLEIGPVERQEMFHADLLGTVAAAKEIRLLAIGAHLRDRMLASRRTADGARRRLDRREAATQAGAALLAAAVAGAGLVWAVGAAAQGRLTIGDISIFVAAVTGVQAALTAMAQESARTHHALLMLGHHLAITDADPDLPVGAAPAPLPALRHGIELRDVWFRYSDAHPWVLRGVDLVIPRGAVLGLVGLNGAGKSTLVKLLCRFYDPTRGSVLWDGVDIREVDPAELRRRVGAVFQDYMCYDMSAADNIGLGDLTALADQPRIEAAARRAGIHDTVAAMPHGYRTLLSRMFLSESDRAGPDSGVPLSGGQWQRLALARAFVGQRRELMILDEPSAALDAAAEEEIHRSLLTFRGGTTLLISHRLNALRDADAIVVLDGGRVVEQGNHATLLSAGGRYARLFHAQASGYQPASPVPEPATGRR
ncbi:ABC transporter ATP-binding protein [Micromonospora zingiberis]|uniref:ABC transporter ATP-binding protein n=1 Tax=Micromonospora zingiberis TaxID=2053011 RepID=A0A4R0GMT2_9ACTN|nr:ABC transporter ATP-binding protein [Micromonospora zingiberis]TCB96821.1 ABC transporter ATP-binding protein [Micromonospora zingiberis]